jgi:asparagine synthase (glutamine-hydrolysing)
MMDRPKMGFGIPIAEWLKNDLKIFVDHYLNENYMDKQGIFNTAEIIKIKKGFYFNKTERAEKIWYLLMFQMWYDKWMNG